MDKARKFLGNCLSMHFSLRVYIYSFLQQKRDSLTEKEVRWIHGFNADPDPAFNLNSEPNPDPGAKPM